MENITSVFEISDLSIYDKTALIYLRSLQLEHGSVFPSYDTIASKCGMSRRKAIDVVKKLVSLELLKKDHHFKTVGTERKQTSNRYDTGVAQDAPVVVPGVTEIAHDAPLMDEPVHSPAPYEPKDFKDLNTEEEDTYITDMPYYPFENEIKKHKVSKEIRTAILDHIKAQGGDIWDYSVDAIRRALKKAVNRMQIGSGLYNPPKWIATAIRNEQYNLDMQL